MSEKVVSIGSKAKKKSEDKKSGTKKTPQSQNSKVEYCSFCKRPNTQIPKLVKGPDVNICSECTLIAVQFLILQDGMLSSEAQRILDLLWGQN